MRRKTLLMSAVACLLAAMAVSSVLTGKNPPVRPEQSLEASLRVPFPVKQMLDRACRDCHSNQTRWPWYSRVPPASWIMSSDVRRARQAMNFSEWSAVSQGNPARAAGMLLAACAGVRSGRMPLSGYRLLHPESRLSTPEIDTFCDWATSESKRLFALDQQDEQRRTDDE